MHLCALHGILITNYYKTLFSSDKIYRKRAIHMNLLFFLTPKAEVAFLYDDFTLRQAIEKMEYHRYSSIPILNRKGEYVGTITEGDILWAIKRNHDLSLQRAEDIPLMSIPRKRDNRCVSVDTSMEELIDAAMRQNFVPVIDGKNSFIGIVKRNSIIRFCYEQYQNGLEQ